MLVGGAVGDHLTLDVADDGVWLGGAPEAEVFNVVDEDGGAEGVLAGVGAACVCVQ